jgi:hypothetical protein
MTTYRDVLRVIALSLISTLTIVVVMFTAVAVTAAVIIAQVVWGCLAMVPVAGLAAGIGIVDRNEFSLTAGQKKFVRWSLCWPLLFGDLIIRRLEMLTRKTLPAAT